MSQQLKKKFIGNDQIDGEKILIEQSQAIRAKDSTNATVDLIKLNGADQLVIPSDAIIEGDLIVQGAITSIESATLEVEDANVVVNKNGTVASADAQGAGITVEMSDATDAALSYDSTLNSKFKIGEIGAQYQVVSVDHSQTLTNKTIDVDNNTVSNLELDNLKAGVLNVSATLAGASDTQVASALAVKSYVDSEVGVVQGAVDAVEDDVSHLVTLSGVAVDSDDLGSFAGSTIGAGKDIKEAFQALETAHENHLNDAEDAHDASAISVSPAVNGEIDVQGSLEDLDSRIDALEVGGGDTKQVKISAADTTEGYLEDKVVGAAGKISVSTIGVGNQDLQIDIGSDVFDKTVDDSDDISEGSINLFFTDLRAQTAVISSTITDGVTDKAPSSDAVYDALALKLNTSDFGTEFDSALALKDSDDLAEGSINLYFTDLRAQTAVISSVITDGVTDKAPSSDAVHDALALKLDKAGDTMTGFLTLHADPSNPLHAATKQYVDAVAEGLHIHAPARALRNSAIAGTYTNGSGGVGAKITPTVAVSNIDGLGSFAVGQRIIINAQANNWENGVYTVSAVEAVTNHVTEFTRASDFDTSTEVAGGDFIFVQAGSTYANTGWVETQTTTAPGFGVSDPIQFVQFSGAGTYSAGDALLLDGTEFNVLFDDISIGVDGSNELYIKDGGVGTDELAATSVTKEKINSDVAGAGLAQNINGSLEIAASAAGDGIDLAAGILSVNVSDIAGAGLEDDGSNNLRIASSAAGDGLSLAAGVLAVNAGDGIQIITDNVAAKVSDFAGAGLEDDGSNNLKIADSAAGDGIGLAAGVLSVNVSDIAGHGLESDGGSPANLRVKKEFSVVEDISVSANGLSIANRWGKEAYTIIAADTVITSDYYDLDFEVEPNSLVAFVDRLAIHEGASFDYTLSVVSGVTRVTFLNELATPGQSKLAIGDQLFFTYEKKAK